MPYTYKTNTKLVGLSRRLAGITLRGRSGTSSSGSSYRIRGHNPKLPRGVRVRTKYRTIGAVRRKLTVTQANELPNRAGTESHLSIKLKPQGLLNKLEGKLQNSTKNYTNDIVVTGGAGVQCFMDPMGTTSEMFSVAHLGSILGEVGTLTGFAGDYRQNAINCFVKSAHQEFMFSNSTNAVVRIQIWDTIARRDCYKDRYGNIMTPAYAMSNGLKEQTSGGTGTEYLTVGQRPTNSNVFNKYFKVKKVTYTDLAPGQVHYHRITYAINRRISNDIIQNTDIQAVKGWTLAPLFIFYGGPVGDNAGGATTEAVRINCVHTITYHFTYLQSSTSISQQTNNLLTNTSGNIENLVTGAQAAYAAVT